MWSARGFTLIELVITVGIVGVLASMAVPLKEMVTKRTQERELRLALREIRSAIDAYKRAADEGKVKVSVGDSGYPKTIEELTSGVDNIGSTERQKIYFLRKLPRDPMQLDASLSAVQSWGKRSYASPPEKPLEGSDVYDIYSLAIGRGLNGVVYRDW
ncbi:MAG: type II secretion system protein [Pseudomonadota bacterium]